MFEDMQDGFPQLYVSILAVSSMPVQKHRQQDRHTPMANYTSWIALW